MCNPRPLSHWRAVGLVPPGTSAATVAAGFRRAHGGREPLKLGGLNLYTEQQLRAALAPPPRPAEPRPRYRPRRRCRTRPSPRRPRPYRPAPWTPPRPVTPPELAATWQAVLARLGRPMPRMFFETQAGLVEFSADTAVVAVVGPWMAMAQTRQPTLAAAFEAALGQPVDLVLRVHPLYWGAGR